MLCCVLGGGCVTAEGWTGVSDHIYSNKGNTDDAYLILEVDVDGFVGKAEFADGQPLPVGTVTFVFDTFCTEQCSFMFMQVQLHRSHLQYTATAAATASQGFFIGPQDRRAENRGRRPRVGVWFLRRGRNLPPKLVQR